ncbi:MAG: alanine--tRNA ligase [Calditrichaeota bacterium]|nr:alanine--tRNA ligase [Calditrichota bacterium]
MTANEIRQQFIDFFVSKGHTFVPSAPVVPQDDPTLLFTNAGMNQFKDIFLGKGKRDYTRAVNSQKCIRVSGKHNDLEEVGRDTYHHTFFEMLGNWSFGDYYKEEAIAWAWELLTKVWKLPKDKLFATVHHTDDEAARIWKEVTDIAPDRILIFGDKDNFWEMGPTGPCGPCSEIHIDLGAEFCNLKGHEHDCGVNGDCGRYIELWNLVFIQFNRDEQGTLHPLPARHVDTGAGFERLVAVLQGKKSNYDTDVFMPIMEKIGELVGQNYHRSSEQMAFRVIADHIRMLTFSIADGGLPSNEGRGYVMRRILRRAARYGRKLNMHEPFMYKIVPRVVEIMGDAYPEIKERMEHVQAVIRAEEEHFNHTLDRGLEIFEKIKNELKSGKQLVIPGHEVFRLYDTYGFPVDLTRILAEEHGLTLDMAGFEEMMEAQRQRARAASKFVMTEGEQSGWVILNEGKDSKFVGYEELAIETHIMRYRITENEIHLVLKETPFYAESGGQIGDKGTISGEGFRLKVTDTQKDGDRIVHICRPLPDFKPKSDKVLAEVISSARRSTQKNHTATHLLHAALRTVLGNHVTQAGSLVEPDRLRFDFTHYERLTSEQVEEIERIVNRKIQQNIPLEISLEKFTEARKKGAMALFGEKYGDIVRTIRIDDFSFELCGGTHVKSTGEIGAFIVVYESGIAAGVRRIEAVTGEKAVEYIQQNKKIVQNLGALLNAGDREILQKAEQLLHEKRRLEKELAQAKTVSLQAGVDDLINKAEIINGIRVIVREIPNVETDQLKTLGDSIREKSPRTVALLITEKDQKLNLVCVVSDDLIKEKKLHAGNLVKEVARQVGGGGGGRPHLATAGGKQVENKDKAIRFFKERLLQNR